MEGRAAPQVPLEAGIGPENPPCPACGEPLFGWAVAPGTGKPVRRCEACGLGVAGAPGDAADARAELERRAGRGPVPNRAGLAAWLGESGWAGIEPGSRYLFTPGSAGLLGIPARKPRPAFGLMWQTILNSFTFGHNLALGRLGRLESVPAGRPWKRRVDAVVTVLAAPPVAVFAAALEAAAALARRGGSLRPG